MFGAVAAVGAGLHVAAYYIERDSELGAAGTAASRSRSRPPIFIAGMYWMYSVLTRSLDPFHLLLLVGTAAVLVASVAARRGRAPRWRGACWCWR